MREIAIMEFKFIIFEDDRKNHAFITNQELDSFQPIEELV